MIKYGRRQRLESDDRSGFLLENCRSDTQVALAGESAPPGEHLVENGAERKNIAAPVEVFAFDLFRGHVLEGADDCAFGGDGSGLRCGGSERHVGGESDGFCQTEIEKLRTRLGEHDVAGL